MPALRIPFLLALVSLLLTACGGGGGGSGGGGDGGATAVRPPATLADVAGRDYRIQALYLGDGVVHTGPGTATLREPDVAHVLARFNDGTDVNPVDDTLPFRMPIAGEMILGDALSIVMDGPVAPGGDLAILATSSTPSLPGAFLFVDHHTPTAAEVFGTWFSVAFEILPGAPLQGVAMGNVTFGSDLRARRADAVANIDGVIRGIPAREDGWGIDGSGAIRMMSLAGESVAGGMSASGQFMAVGGHEQAGAAPRFEMLVRPDTALALDALAGTWRGVGVDALGSLRGAESVTVTLDAAGTGTAQVRRNNGDYVTTVGPLASSARIVALSRVEVTLGGTPRVGALSADGQVLLMANPAPEAPGFLLLLRVADGS